MGVYEESQWWYPYYLQWKQGQVSDIERIKSFEGWRGILRAKIKESESWLSEIRANHKKCLTQIMGCDEMTFFFVQEYLKAMDKTTTDRLERVIRTYRWMLQPKKAQGLLNDENKARIKEIPLEAIFDHYGVEKRATAYFCPFHDEKTPSLVIHRKENLWKCFGCGLGGDAFTFVMKKEDLDFKEAFHALLNLV